MEREACVCDHGFERSDLCAEIIIIIIIMRRKPASKATSLAKRSNCRVLCAALCSIL